MILINFIFKDDPLPYCVSLDTFLVQDILDVKLSVNRESNLLLKIQLFFHIQSQYFGVQQHHSFSALAPLPPALWIIPYGLSFEI